MAAFANPLGAGAPPQYIVVLFVPLPTGKVDKIPVDHRTGTPYVSAHDPAFWTTYEQAAAVARLWGDAFGVGFVITGADPYVCIDIDGALQPDRSWSPLAIELCQSVPGAVVEVSHSSRGLHVWARSAAPVPPHTMKRVDLGIEAYSELRFIALGTGAVGVLADDCPGVREVLARYFPARVGPAVDVPAEGPCEGYSGPVDDDALIALALASRSAASVFGAGVTFRQLWEADADALGRKWPAEGRAYDASSADAALAQRLAFYTGRDVTRCEGLMRRSALAREKFDRPDYLPRTIEAACARQTGVYQARGAAAPVADAPAAPERYAEMLIAEDPLTTARELVARHYMRDGSPCLKAWQDSFYRWGGAAWCELKAADVRARLYEFIDRKAMMFKANQARVTNVVDALKAAAHLDSTLSPPCWIGDTAGPPPSDLIACANGLLHLPTRTMLPATPQLFNLNAVPFNYEPQAPEPVNWLQFLNAVWPNDPEAIGLLQELFGYLLTPDTSQQKIFLVIGPKRSGKGTIARVLTEMLGAANVAGPTLSSMATPFGLHPLVGKLAAIISDARLSGRTDQKDVAENLLRISGEDRIEVARKFLDPLTMKLGVRFVLLTNELPKIADASGAMASRFVILTMTESFIGREDPALTSKLLRELPGVLAWAVDGWHRLQARGHFVEPKSSAGAAQELADLGSPISAFVREECRCVPMADVEVSALYSTWRTWCSRQGIVNSGSAQTFGRDLRAAFPAIRDARPRIGGERTRVYQGIALRGPQWSAVHPIAT